MTALDGSPRKVLSIDNAITGFVTVGNERHALRTPSFSVRDRIATTGVDYTFLYRRTITIDYTKVPNNNHMDFPLYLYISDLVKANVLNSGADFVIYASDDTTRLPIEIQNYDSSGATGVLHAWVKVPTLSSSENTILYLYYGNASFSQPAANDTYGAEHVWASAFKLVMHTHDDPDSSTLQDSSGSGYACTKTGAGTPEEQAGKMYKLQNKDNRDAVGILIGDSAALGMTSWTIVFWGYAGSSNPANEFVDKGSAGNGWHIFCDSAGGSYGPLKFEGKDASNAAIEWYANGAVKFAEIGHHVIAYHTTELTRIMTRNGVNNAITVINAGSGGIQDDTTNMGFLNTISPKATFYTAKIEEVWVLEGIVANTVDWSTALYNNQNSPATFYAIAAETGDTKTVGAGLGSNIEIIDQVDKGVEKKARWKNLV